MKKYYKVFALLMVFIFFGGGSVMSAVPCSIDTIETFLAGQCEPNTNFGVSEFKNEFTFEGVWAYTAIAHESGNINISKESTGGLPTFTTNNRANWGILDHVNFDSDNLYFDDLIDGPVNIALDPYASPSVPAFKVFELLSESNLYYLEGNANLSLPEGAFVVGFNDNFPSAGDADYDDIIIAMFPDKDYDGVADSIDNCPDLGNADQGDRDGDSWGNPCDNCPDISNEDQADENENGIGDVCEVFAPQDSDLKVVGNDFQFCVPYEGDVDIFVVGPSCDRIVVVCEDIDGNELGTLDKFPPPIVIPLDDDGSFNLDEGAGDIIRIEAGDPPTCFECNLSNYVVPEDVSKVSKCTATWSNFVEVPNQNGEDPSQKLTTGIFGSVSFETLKIEIDIVPAKINPKTGKIPVEILSSESFDATKVQKERKALTFGVTGFEESLHLQGKDQSPACNEKYINDDDLLDLKCNFLEAEIGDWDLNTGKLCLSGVLEDGKTRVWGCDAVQINP